MPSTPSTPLKEPTRAIAAGRGGGSSRPTSASPSSSKPTPISTSTPNTHRATPARTPTTAGRSALLDGRVSATASAAGTPTRGAAAPSTPPSRIRAAHATPVAASGSVVGSLASGKRKADAVTAGETTPATMGAGSTPSRVLGRGPTGSAIATPAASAAASSPRASAPSSPVKKKARSSAATAEQAQDSPAALPSVANTPSATPKRGLTATRGVSNTPSSARAATHAITPTSAVGTPSRSPTKSAATLAPTPTTGRSTILATPLRQMAGAVGSPTLGRSGGSTGRSAGGGGGGAGSAVDAAALMELSRRLDEGQDEDSIIEEIERTLQDDDDDENAKLPGEVETGAEVKGEPMEEPIEQRTLQPDATVAAEEQAAPQRVLTPPPPPPNPYEQLELADNLRLRKLIQALDKFLGLIDVKVTTKALAQALPALPEEVLASARDQFLRELREVIRAENANMIREYGLDEKLRSLQGLVGEADERIQKGLKLGDVQLKDVWRPNLPTQIAILARSNPAHRERVDAMKESLDEIREENRRLYDGLKELELEGDQRRVEAAGVLDTIDGAIAGLKASNQAEQQLRDTLDALLGELGPRA